MDFELTAEQELIQGTVRSFVDERVLPNAIENDINHHLDLGVIEGMAELSLLGLVVVFASLSWIATESRGKFDGLSLLFAFGAAVLLIIVFFGQSARLSNDGSQKTDNEN